jgi:hypothetical protein
MSPLIARSHVLTFPAFPAREVVGAEHEPYIEYSETLDLLGNRGPGVGAQWVLESFYFQSYMRFVEVEGGTLTTTIAVPLNLTLRRSEQIIYIKNVEYTFIEFSAGIWEFGFASTYEQFIAPILLLPGEPLTLTMKSHVSCPLNAGGELPKHLRAEWAKTSLPGALTTQGGMMYSIENYEQLGAGHAR